MADLSHHFPINREGADNSAVFYPHGYIKYLNFGESRDEAPHRNGRISKLKIFCFTETIEGGQCPKRYLCGASNNLDTDDVFVALLKQGVCNLCVPGSRLCLEDAGVLFQHCWREGSPVLWVVGGGTFQADGHPKEVLNGFPHSVNRRDMILKLQLKLQSQTTQNYTKLSELENCKPTLSRFYCGLR